MNTTQEFQYKLPGSPGGSRPGSHRSTSLGPGMSFAAHRRLFDQPDPRRLDLRASLRDVRGEWLVRANRQSSSVTIQVLMDVSSSMCFGADRSKIEVACDFIEALGYSAYRNSDAVGMMAFDARARDDLYLPPRSSRAIASTMTNQLRALQPGNTREGNIAGLSDCISRLTLSNSLVFILSDFHWPLESLSAELNKMGQTLVVPMVIWDPAEIRPPDSTGWLSVIDAESGRSRDLWVRKSIREKWTKKVAQRRANLNAIFKAQHTEPFYIEGTFENEALTQYFMDHVL